MARLRRSAQTVRQITLCGMARGWKTGWPATRSPIRGRITLHCCLGGLYTWQFVCYKIGVLFPLKQLSHLFKALSDSRRLRIVNLLDAQSLCVRDLQEVLGLSQPLVSRHLAVLRAANLVSTRRQGAKISYSLSRAPFLNYPLGNFLSDIVPFFPQLQADAQKLAELKGVRTLAQDHTVAPDMHGATNQGISERLRGKVEERGKPKERRR